VNTNAEAGGKSKSDKLRAAVSRVREEALKRIASFDA